MNRTFETHSKDGTACHCLLCNFTAHTSQQVEEHFVREHVAKYEGECD